MADEQKPKSKQDVAAATAAARAATAKAAGHTGTATARLLEQAADERKRQASKAASHKTGDNNSGSADRQTGTAAGAQAEPTKQPRTEQDFIDAIVKKIGAAENIVVTLSRDPSVDEMAAAIGLTLFLDRLGKHATAIYSGRTPRILEFLHPDATFEHNTDSLRDFIIALSKDKADHLRYKLDGDFVKIYVTPYKTTLSAEDLDFTYGDYNVDLVLVLDIASEDQLDTALKEFAKITENAEIVDITTNAPGQVGQLEWSERRASSVSELVAKLVIDLEDSDTTMSADEATAFLTGIVAETDRFANEKTDAEVMALAADLMDRGADQKLIPRGIQADADAEEPKERTADAAKSDTTEENEATDTTTPAKSADSENELQIVRPRRPHRDRGEEEVTAPVVVAPTEVTPAAPEVSPAVVVATPEVSPTITPVAPEVSSEATPAAPAVSTEPSPAAPVAAPETTPATPEPTAPLMGAVDLPAPELNENANIGGNVTITPPEEEAPKDYASMMAEALAEPIPGMPATAQPTTPAPTPVEATPAPAPAPVEVTPAPVPTEAAPAPTEITPAAPVAATVAAPDPTAATPAATNPIYAPNPAALATPTVSDQPELNGVPAINYAEPVAQPDPINLPPPPAPPVDMNVALPTPPAVPAVATTTPEVAPAAPVTEPVAATTVPAVEPASTPVATPAPAAAPAPAVTPTPTAAPAPVADPVAPAAPPATTEPAPNPNATNAPAGAPDAANTSNADLGAFQIPGM